MTRDKIRILKLTAIPAVLAIVAAGCESTNVESSLQHGRETSASPRQSSLIETGSISRPKFSLESCLNEGDGGLHPTALQYMLSIDNSSLQAMSEALFGQDVEA